VHLFVFGVVCNERRHEWRARLRALYGPRAPEVLPIFVISDEHERNAKWQQRELTAGAKTSDDVLFVPAANKAAMIEKHHAYREAHCAHKTMGWWQMASRWPSVWYGKTDDDAVFDLPPLLDLLSRLPSGPVYGGIVHYSSVNTTNLEGGCFSSGAYGAVRKRYVGREAKVCSQLAGPFPYVEGPLEILSSDVQRFLAPRALVDPRQRCHYEDFYIGMYLAEHPELSLVNLDGLLGHKDVWQSGTGRWLGTDGFLAHWVRTDEAFRRVSDGFARARQLRHPDAMAMRCGRWADSFEALYQFPCCHNWTICEPLTPHLRTRQRLVVGGAT